jgi:excisionase family DNA binding protein
MVPGWLKIKDAAKYAGVSERTLEDWLKQGLKFAQIPSGLRLIKPEWIDNYLERYIQDPVSKQTRQIHQIVDGVLKELRA